VAQAQTTVAERAQSVNQRRETLRLALQYAADLNHELLVTMQEAASDTDGQTYTAEGQSDPGTPDRSFVDTVG
jgi:pyrroloquinoline quinone (PQQ) biosynthesis protein C